MTDNKLTITGRTPIPWYKKINPIWWFGNDSEQTVDQASWYLPGYPKWIRQTAWALRNPLQNFRAYVWGVQDRDLTVHVVYGAPDPTVVQRNDIGQTGYQVTLLHLANSPIKLPFVSYSGKYVTWYAGWQPGPGAGFFGTKFNIK